MINLESEKPSKCTYKLLTQKKHFKRTERFYSALLIIKRETDYYSHSFFSFLKADSKRRNLFNSNCSTRNLFNEYLGNTSKLSQRVPFQFLLFKRNIQNRTRLKGPLFHFFRRCETFFRLQRVALQFY